MRRAFCRIVLIPSVLILLQQCGRLYGQQTHGFDIVAPATATIQEQNYQYDFWVLETHMKPLRMIRVEIPDAKTGQKKRVLVWYLVYKAIHRPLAKKNSETDTIPANRFDPDPSPPLFAPEFLLVTDDDGVQKIYADEIIPEAQAAINRRERQVFKNSVQVVGPLPPVTASEDAQEHAIYGVAMWRGIDPDTDYFTIYLSGFSNGYKYVRGPVSYKQLQELVDQGQLGMADQVWDMKSEWNGAGEILNLFDRSKLAPKGAESTSWFYSVTSDELESGEPTQIWRRTLMQKYWRPGDRFDQSELEFRPQGDPVWLYRADQAVKSVTGK